MEKPDKEELLVTPPREILVDDKSKVAGAPKTKSAPEKGTHISRVPPSGETLGFEWLRWFQLYGTTPSDIGGLIEVRERVAKGEAKKETNWFPILLGVGILFFIILVGMQMLPDLLKSFSGIIPTGGGGGQTTIPTGAVNLVKGLLCR